MATADEIYDEAHKLAEGGDLEAAVAKLEEALALDETHVLSHSAIGVHLHKLGKLDDAVKHATRVTELDPTDPFSFTQLSVICQRCGLIQEAEDAMARAQQIQATGGA